MVNKIEFVVSADGEISPKVEQSAGVQGSHNVTQVVFDVSELKDYDFAATNIRTRIQFIDGAGGFESTGFLNVDLATKKVSTLVPRSITNAGGVAKVHLVVTKISYDGDVANEDEVFLSWSGKIRFESSGVGSPSNNMYLKGISSALVNAETFVGLAETASDNAEIAKNDAATAATSAARSAVSAASELQALRDGIANGDFKGEPGETPSLDGVIQFWQPNIEYKVGDRVIANTRSGWYGNPQTQVLKCEFSHTSTDLDDDLFIWRYWTIDVNDRWNVEYVWAEYGYRDYLGNLIPETYATKEEVVGILRTINEILADLVEVE